MAAAGLEGDIFKLLTVKALQYHPLFFQNYK